MNPTVALRRSPGELRFSCPPGGPPATLVRSAVSLTSTSSFRAPVRPPHTKDRGRADGRTGLDRMTSIRPPARPPKTRCPRSRQVLVVAGGFLIGPDRGTRVGLAAEPS